MKTNRLLTLLAAGLLSTVLTGCILAVGNTEHPKANSGSATLGQELTDLKKARDANVLSEDEYQAQRKRLLDHQNKK